MVDENRQRSRSRLNLWGPWSWVLIAAGLRLAMLSGLASLGSIAAIRPDLGLDRNGSLPSPSGPIEFLQRRIVYRPLTEDESAYDEMARNITSGRGFVLDRVWQITTPGEPAMFAGCGYPLFVACVYWTFGTGNQLPVYLIQIVAHSLAAGLVLVTARQVAGPIAGVFAAGFYALHPMLIWSSVALMSEALVIPLVCVLFWLITHRRALGSTNATGPWRAALMAAVLAVLCLTRSTFAYFVPIAAGMLIWECRSSQWWTRGVKSAGIFAGVFVAVCTPWTIRNYSHFGKLIPFSTKRGCAAYVFNHDGLRAEFGPAAVGGPQPINLYGPEMAALPDELARDEKCMRMFLDFVREKPGKFLLLCWIRFWMAVLPVAITAHSKWAVVAAWYIKGIPLALMVAGIICARARLWYRILPMVLFVLQVLAIQTVSGAGMRYRLPADPVWACLAGIVVAVVLARLRIFPGEFGLAQRWSHIPRAEVSGRTETREMATAS